MPPLVLVVVLAAISQAHGQRCVKNVLEISAVRVDLKKPLKYALAERACYKLPGYVTLKRFDKLTDEEKAICGDQLVPYSLSYEIPRIPKLIAVNLMTGETKTVSKRFKFPCILCQHLPVDFTDGSTGPSIQKGYTTSAHFMAHVTEINPSGNDTVTKELKKQLTKALHKRIMPMGQNAIKFARSWLDETQRLNIEFRIIDSISTSVDVETGLLNGTFSMQVEDVAFCPEEDTVGVDGVVTHWPRRELEINEDVVEFATDAATGAIAGRVCFFDYKAFHGAWIPTPSRWELHWVPCTVNQQYINEMQHIQFLNASDIKLRHAEVLQPGAKRQGKQ